MKMTKKVLAMLLVMSMVFAATACGLGSGDTGSAAGGGSTASGEVPADDASYQEIADFILQPSDNPDKVVIRYASMASEEQMYSQPYLRGYLMFMKWVKEDMGDAVEFQFILNGSIGGTVDAVIGGLQNGNFEMCDYTTTSCGDMSAAYKPLDLFYLVTSFDDMAALLDGDAGTLMNEQFLKDTKVKNICYGILGPRQMTNSKKPITSPQDMKGLKMRVQNNDLHVLGMKSLGGNPATIAYSELFTALQQGTVDGQENPVDTILTSKFYEVQDYMSTTNHIIATAGLFVSDEWYAALPEDVKASMETNAPKSQEYARNMFNEEYDNTLGKLKEEMEVTELTEDQLKAFQDAAKKSWGEARNMIGSEYFDKVMKAAGIEF